jgi:hypothetical protein
MRVRDVVLMVVVVLAFGAWVWLCLDVLWPAYVRGMM